MPNILADRVLESSVSAGTGVFTLAGAVLGFRAFSAVCAVTDTMPYYIEAVDALGRPTGEWEFGLGTYTAANQLTRTTVRGSSNAGLAVAFGAGTKLVGLGIAAPNSTATRLEWRDALSVYSRAEVDALITASLTPAASTTVAGKVELATNTEAQTGTDATRAVTPDNLAAVVPGMEQTLTPVANVFNTNYVNGPRVRFVNVTGITTAGSATGNSIGLQINGGQQVIGSGAGGNGAGWPLSTFAMIPPNATYRANCANATIGQWLEYQ